MVQHTVDIAPPCPWHTSASRTWNHSHSKTYVFWKDIPQYTAAPSLHRTLKTPDRKSFLFCVASARVMCGHAISSHTYSNRSNRCDSRESCPSHHLAPARCMLDETDLNDMNRIAEILIRICGSTAVGTNIPRVQYYLFYVRQFFLRCQCADMLCVISLALLISHGFSFPVCEVCLFRRVLRSYGLPTRMLTDEAAAQFSKHDQI